VIEHEHALAAIAFSQRPGADVMAKRTTKVKLKETPPISLDARLQSVRVSRPKSTLTVVDGVDDIDVRDGSLLLLKRTGGGDETCMMVFSPGQWISVNVDPV
jgi:hypothetical protein